MKKIFILIVLVLSTFFISACSFLDDLLDQVQLPFDQAVAKYSGQKAFSYSSKYETYLHFYYANDNISVVIDSSLDAVYIQASKNAIELFDSLEFISISWIIKNPDEINWGDEDGSNFDIVIISHYRSSERTICSDEDDENDDGVLGCNVFWFSEKGEIFASEIYFNLDAIPEDTDPLVIEAIAIHELGHTFGLDDLYQDSLEGHSIMYYQIDLDFPAVLTLTDWDKSNLAWMYNKKE
jgi:hypothetical protein